MKRNWHWREMGKETGTRERERGVGGTDLPLRESGQSTGTRERRGKKLAQEREGGEKLAPEGEWAEICP